MTNDPKLSALEVLHAYKRQPQIEKRFEQLKPDFAVAPVFLKDVGRIEALFCVYFFALLAEAPSWSGNCVRRCSGKGWTRCRSGRADDARDRAITHPPQAPPPPWSPRYDLWRLTDPPQKFGEHAKAIRGKEVFLSPAGTKQRGVP